MSSSKNWPRVRVGNWRAADLTADVLQRVREDEFTPDGHIQPGVVERIRREIAIEDAAKAADPKE